jgi:hypothetical protein
MAYGIGAGGQVIGGLIQGYQAGKGQALAQRAQEAARLYDMANRFSQYATQYSATDPDMYHLAIKSYSDAMEKADKLSGEKGQGAWKSIRPIFAKFIPGLAKDGEQQQQTAGAGQPSLYQMMAARPPQSEYEQRQNAAQQLTGWVGQFQGQDWDAVKRSPQFLSGVFKYAAAGKTLGMDVWKMIEDTLKPGEPMITVPHDDPVAKFGLGGMRLPMSMYGAARQMIPEFRPLSPGQGLYNPASGKIEVQPGAEPVNMQDVDVDFRPMVNGQPTNLPAFGRASYNPRLGRYTFVDQTGVARDVSQAVIGAHHVPTGGEGEALPFSPTELSYWKDQIKKDPTLINTAMAGRGARARQQLNEALAGQQTSLARPSLYDYITSRPDGSVVVNYRGIYRGLQSTLLSGDFVRDELLPYMDDYLPVTPEQLRGLSQSERDAMRARGGMEMRNPDKVQLIEYLKRLGVTGLPEIPLQRPTVGMGIGVPTPSRR